MVDCVMTESKPDAGPGIGQDAADKPATAPEGPADLAGLRAARGPGDGGSDTRPDEGYDIRIARDGTWFYHGSPIGRLPLVKLFSTVLRRDEAGDYWLITPAERGRIRVDDAPFVAVEMRREGEGRGQALSFRTNLDHWVTAGAEHPIRVAIDPATGEPSPYIHVRGDIGRGLEARLNRPVFYELADMALAKDGAKDGAKEGAGDGPAGVWSQGVFFRLEGA
ncbi:hypothetical protein FBZ89_105135 [Nitrospirillum amazonense]|uniref:DUF1285 domain-containing protein n=2 Tax=Nitrospirillum amazonense TaxID=28077 RepID=A0A560FI39_9PROT|nr:hypothetical protein FBZ89_105135 [Nitrospirillum amazonense]